MPRRTAPAGLVVFLALLAPAARAGPLGSLPGKLVESGQQKIEHGKKEGKIVEIVEGYVEKTFGKLLGGGDKNPNQGHGGDKEEKPKEEHEGNNPHDQPEPPSAPRPDERDKNEPVPPHEDSARGPAQPPPAPGGPEHAAPVQPAPGDSTLWVKFGDERSADGRPLAENALRLGSGEGSLVAVGAARGRVAVAGRAQPQDASSQAGRPAEPPAADSLGPSPLDKVPGRIAGVDAAVKSSRRIEEILREGKRKIALGDFDGALEDFSRAIAEDPANPLAWTRRAEAYNRLKRYPEALADGLEAVRLAPSSGAAWEQVAWAQYKLGRLSQALQAADEALRLNPANATGYYIRSLIKAKLGDMKGAREDAERAAALNPKFHDFLERALMRGRFTEAEEESSLGDGAAGAPRPGSGWPWAAGFGALITLAAAAAAAARRPSKSPSGPAAAVPKNPGRLSGKYELKGMIGKGGMGQVYEALDHSLGRLVAIKKMSARLSTMTLQARGLVLKEAKTVAALRHPSIVDIYEILEEGQDLFLVFELVKGKTAQHLLAERGRLPLREVFRLLGPVCEALEFAHSREVVHRDLKPANIMLTEHGAVKLMDFGVARSVADAAPPKTPAQASSAPDLGPFAQTESVLGTPQYMAPESVRGVVCKQGDVYALGVCLYEMTTGKAPFQNLTQKISLDFQKASDCGLPAELDELIAAALYPDPLLRLQSPLEFSQRLEAVLNASERPAGIPPAKGIPPARPSGA